MTLQQTKRLETFRKTHSVRGVVELNDGTVQIGYERSGDGRDREVVIGTDGRTISNRNTYSYA